jgi:hypothetical protein
MFPGSIHDVTSEQVPSSYALLSVSAVCLFVTFENIGFVFCCPNFLHRHYKCLKKHMIRWQGRKHRFTSGMTILPGQEQREGYAQGLSPYKFIAEGHTVRKEMYIEMLHCFWDAFRRKWHEIACTFCTSFAGCQKVPRQAQCDGFGASPYYLDLSQPSFIPFPW